MATKPFATSTVVMSTISLGPRGYVNQDVGLPFMPINGDPWCHQYYLGMPINAHIVVINAQCEWPFRKGQTVTFIFLIII